MSAEAALRQLSLFGPERLAHRPYCTDELGALVIRPVKVAVGNRYIQANCPALRWRVVFDVDRGDGANAWRYGEVAIPNWTATNPDNGHAHLGYEIEHAITLTEAAHQAPIRFAAAIEDAYRDRLEADISYAGFICKNPLNPHWEVEELRDRPYDLPELADWVDLSGYSQRQRKVSDYGIGRNCTLFDRARFWAYRHVEEFRRDRLRGAWSETVLNYAIGVNDEFNTPLHFSEVRCTAKSVSGWTWEHYTGSGNSKVRGILKLDPEMPLAEKQQRAADYVNKKRRAAMENTIRNAIAALTAKGERVSMRAIAKLSGISQQAISQHYRHLLDQTPPIVDGAIKPPEKQNRGAVI